VQVAVLRCGMARADDGGGLWRLEPMMEVACVHVWALRCVVVSTAVPHHQI
jgi:hypothetical protein